MLIIFLIGAGSLDHGHYDGEYWPTPHRRFTRRTFAHIQMLSMAYHDQHRVGDLMSRVTNDTEAISRVLSDGLINLSPMY